MQKQKKDQLLEKLMLDYGDALLRLAFTYVKNENIAKDMVQNSFIKCYEKLDTFGQRAQYKTWLYRITINECKDYLKSWYRNKVSLKSRLSETFQGMVSSAENEVIETVNQENLITLLFTLPKRYREVLYLFYYDSLKINEISELLGVSTNTVKTRLRRGREKLKLVKREAQFHE